MRGDAAGPRPRWPFKKKLRSARQAEIKKLGVQHKPTMCPVCGRHLTGWPLASHIREAHDGAQMTWRNGDGQLMFPPKLPKAET